MTGTVLLVLCFVIGPTLALIAVSRHLGRDDRREQRQSETD